MKNTIIIKERKTFAKEYDKENICIHKSYVKYNILLVVYKQYYVFEYITITY